jgi:transposase
MSARLNPRRGAGSAGRCLYISLRSVRRAAESGTIMKHNAAGIDVHKKILAVAVGKGTEGGLVFERKLFGTVGKALTELAEWLKQQGVEEVVMESTAQYWKPVWLALEGSFDLHLAQARSNLAPKGRKTDFRDAERMVRRLLSGDLTLSFVPNAEQRQWRLLARSKYQLRRDRVRLQNQREGLLEEGRIKLSSVVTDLLGLSSLRILRALAAGEEDAVKLADLADSRLRVSREDLAEALRGSVTQLQRLLLNQYLKRLDLIDSQIQELDRALAAERERHSGAIRRLTEIPGMGPDAAAQIVAEIGPEAEAFAAPEKLASWVGVCPGRQESAGESTSNRSPKGNRPMRRILTEVAFAAVKTKDSHFQEVFRRLVPRLGVKKAIWAIAHRICRLIWKLLHEGVSYQEQGARSQDPQAIRKRARKLIGDLRRLGYNVLIEEPDPKAA